ncbi:hypothetical protein QC763_0020340 [Podospora pseudopauciseta]|uniref:Uncharacterized protein n=1 Tax=Podospora pseudopauciseta TaxID=2093780 RepID=A0ABR0I1D6_9PEZI|nr:hypothetical protein QC763_0020340 [Podospora pseudopauciseta]
MRDQRVRNISHKRDPTSAQSEASDQVDPPGACGDLRNCRNLARLLVLWKLQLRANGLSDPQKNPWSVTSASQHSQTTT